VHPKWRLFRHDAGRTAGPKAWAYVLLFLLSIAIGQWSLWRYGVVVAWPANAVLAAALLQLHRKPAVGVLGACFVINLIGNWLRAGYLQGEPGYMMPLNALLNAGEAFLTALLARRFCGAALDMRRPIRLTRFVLMAVVPAVLIAAVIGSFAKWGDLGGFLPSVQGYFTVEGLAMLIVTPSLLLLARQRRLVDRVPGQGAWEPALLMTALIATSLLVFAQNVAPLQFAVFLPLLLIAFRLSPAWSALSVIVVAVIAAGFTYNGMGPMTLSGLNSNIWHTDPGLVPLQRATVVFNLFMAAVLCVSLPASTVMTERRRLEARLKARTDAAIQARRAAERAAEAKSRFLSMMSHEMRTPLNGVAGYAELLAGRRCLDAEAARDVAGIRRSGERLSALVDDILDFAHDEVKIVEAPFSLAFVAREVMAAVREEAEAKGLALSLNGDLDDQRRHLGDERRVRQVLRHLLANAVKFTPSGKVETTVRFGAAGAEIRVCDTGPGLSPTVLSQLFQPFEQGDASTRREHEGAGMGLALSRRLVESMGGAIAGENLPGGGAAFTVRLPLVEAEALAPAAEVTSAADPHRAPQVLVVDDHPTNREVARRMLEAVGCEVSIACDGVEAVEAVGLAAYDLVLMDVRMPRMDGLEATRAIRRAPGREAATAIVAMTADAMPDDVARCLAAGMDAHLAKPISIASLAGVLERFLHPGDDADAVAAAAS
jgi:signal transduction histidine kinase/ActR/RegA family two-component response regulator